MNRSFSWVRVSVLVLAGLVLGRLGWADMAASVPSKAEALEQLSATFRQVGAQVEPSVVNIRAVKRVGPGAMRMPMPFDDDMLRRFFPDRDGDGRPDLPPELTELGQPGEPLPPRQAMGNGSGVIVQVDGKVGYIVTNNHVAGDADELIVTLADERELRQVTLVGTDAKTDLALLRVEAEGLQAAKWGDSDKLERGDWVLAFGSPFGLVGSMTHGIVTGRDRRLGMLGQMGYERFLQVDAAINPGNSGGPLVNLRGEVVGINTAIASMTGGFQGVGLAIPSNQARQVVEQLREHGKVTRGWLGVSISDVRRDLPKARSFGWDKPDGVLVEQTIRGTPAFGALEPGDIVVKLDGREVRGVQELRDMVAATRPGTEVKLEVWREGAMKTVSLTIGRQPEDRVAAGGAPRAPGAPEVGAELGLRLAALDVAARQRLGVDGEVRGVVVTGVAPGSAAQRAGIGVGEVLTMVNRRPVASVAEAAEALREADLTKGVRLYLVSREGGRFVLIQESGR